MGDFGAWIICFSIFIVFCVILNNRDKKNRLVGAVCFVLLFSTPYFISQIYGSRPEKQLLSPDKLSANAFHAFVRPYYDKNIEVFWNPYIFGGMPQMASLTTNLIGRYYSQAELFIMDAIILWIKLSILYLCFRFYPSKFEQRLFKKAGTFLNNYDNIFIALVLLLMLAWVYALCKSLYYTFFH